MKIFFSVGEPSGDLHGANLVRELLRRRGDIECVGYGGPRMSAAGCRLHEDLTKLAVMFLARVILNLHRFWSLWRQADRYFRDERPDAVVLIDYPGFNWWIARSAKRYGIPVFYYGVPQMWAWAGWRVRKMRRLIDHVLCKLPFEAAWFQARGCQATYVGHPYFDEVCGRELDRTFVNSMSHEGNLVTILPGSRTQEVLSNLPWFLRTAAIVEERMPGVRFAIAAFNEYQASLARDQVRASHLPIEVFVGRTPELIEAARCCLACSGSVSLELLYHEKPTVILYYIRRFTYALQRYFLTVRYITLVNLLASRDAFTRPGSGGKPVAPEPIPFPEYLTWKDPSPQLADHLIEWLRRSEDYDRRVTQLRELKRAFAQPGASATAADYILHALQNHADARAVPRHRSAA